MEHEPREGIRPQEWSSTADGAFRHLEHAGYMLLGLLLAGAAAVALAGAAQQLLRSVLDWSGTDAIFTVIDRLLFVFMLIEILHTVRASLRSGGLSCEPFLVVGLIASIRRVLVITLQTSQVTRQSGWTAQTQQILNASMIELGVMAGLILAMVCSIYLLHRAKPQTGKAVGTSE